MILVFRGFVFKVPDDCNSTSLESKFPFCYIVIRKPIRIHYFKLFNKPKQINPSPYYLRKGKRILIKVRHGLTILWKIGIRRLKEGGHPGSLGILQTRGFTFFVEGIRLMEPEVLIKILIGG